MGIPSRSATVLHPLRGRRPTPLAASAVVGQVVGRTDGGEPLVDFPGNDRGPLMARVVVERVGELAIEAGVLLVFDDGDRGRPVIVGSVGDGRPAAAPASTTADLTTPQDVVVDVPSLVVEARRQIVLRCGAGSVTIRADGTIVIKGTNLLSRSSGSNRIKGGSVRIN